MPATTISEAYLAANPDEALKANDRYYEDFTAWRGNRAVRDKIAREISLSEPAGPEGAVKQLFAGHRGCGKTSELFRLKAKLEDNGFFVSYVNAALTLDVNDVSYTDILLTTVYGLVDDVHASEIGLTVPRRTLQDLLRRLLETREVEREVTLEADTEIKAELEAGGGLAGFLKVLGRITSRLKASAQRRDVLRQTIEPNLSFFLADLNDIIDNLRVQLRDKGLKGPVLIVDSLDRIIPHQTPDGGTTHTDLFINHAEQLKAPHCHVVYTVPISIYYSRTLLPLYPNPPRVLPMVKVRDRDENECEGALDAMERAVRLRMDVEALFENPTDVRELCRVSGGHIRDLMHLLREACLYDDDRITSEAVEQSIKSLVAQYERTIRDEDVPKLVEVRRQKEVPNKPGYELLPYHLLVLEYENDDYWADVHPAVLRTRKVREALDADGRDEPIDG